MLGRLFLVLIGIILISKSASSQKSVIRGEIFDSLSNQPLIGASISAFLKQINLNKISIITNTEGNFEITNLEGGDYQLSITFKGYKSRLIEISLPNKSSINLGKIKMQIKADTLKNVTVYSGPIQIKKDTIEYSANYFKTQTNAALEELLKKLPGILVNSDGSITVNGETITEILVDGENFFSGSQLLVIKNLPAEIIEKIQVYKAQSEQSKFTGFNNGKKTNTINIIIKKNKKKGQFGNIEAGLGINNKYDESANINYFNNAERISIVEKINNINNQNTLMSNSPSSGISITSLVGLNYSNHWSKTKVNGSGIYTNENTKFDQQVTTQTLLPNNLSTNTNLNQSLNTNTKSKKININLEKKIDSLNSIIIHSTLNLSNTSLNSLSQSTLTNVATNESIYNTNNQMTDDNTTSNFLGSFLFMHKFKKPFQTISLEFNIGNLEKNSNNNNNVLTRNSLLSYIDTINNIVNRSLNNTRVGLSLSMTEPINTNQILELSYKFNSNESKSKNTANKLNNLTGKFDLLDTAQTNTFEHLGNSQALSLLYKFQHDKLNLTIGPAIQINKLSNNNYINNPTTTQTYISILPILNLSYDISQSKNLALNYQSQSRQPSLQELQPINITNDSLIIYKGNPLLKQSYTHTFSFFYTSVNSVNFQNFSANINTSVIENDIQNNLTQLPNGTQINSPINLSGSFNISGSTNWGISVKKIKSQINLATNFSFSQNHSIVNEQSNYSKFSSLTQNITFTTNGIKNIDLNITSSSMYNILHSSLNTSGNYNYFTQNTSLEIGLLIRKDWVLKSKLNYIYNSQVTDSKATSLLSVSLGKQFLKNKRLGMRVEIFDLLNQNRNIYRMVTNNVIQDIKSNTLNRYSIFKINYNINYFKNQK